MTSTVADMDILKDIPGYKAIMKAVLKTQIQLLVEQLSDHTGEESIVLTASVNDGSLSHLGSLTGKGFLEGRDEIKSQFLAYCLKSHHKRKTQEEPAPPYQRSNISHPGPRTATQQTSKRPRLHPMAVNRSGSQGSDPEGSLHGDGSRDAMFTSTPAKGTQQSQRGISSDSLVGQSKTLPSESPSMLKHEQSGAVLGGDGDSSDIRTDLMAPASLPPTIGLSHTQTSSSGAGDNSQQSDKEQSDTGVASQEGGASIKIEPNTESELDLEITGIEGGDNSSQMSGENWDQNVSGFGGTMGDGSFDQSGSQAGYKKSDVDKEDGKFVSPSSQPVFPGQLSPFVSAPQFDMTGFDPSMFDTSAQQKANSDTPSNDLGNSTDKSIEQTLDSDTVRQTLNKMLFPGQDPMAFYRAHSQYARAESLFKMTRPPGLFFCKFCGKVMQNKSVYEYHLRTHTGEKPYKCEVCNRHFAGRQPLETHQRLHTGERPFSCAICQKSFTARSGRDYHQRKHHINMFNEFVSTPALQSNELIVTSGLSDTIVKASSANVIESSGTDSLPSSDLQ